jgi:hypothetical protein
MTSAEKDKPAASPTRAPADIPHETRLDTRIRPDQAINLHKLKIFRGMDKSQVVKDALDLYFRQEHNDLFSKRKE